VITLVEMGKKSNLKNISSKKSNVKNASSKKKKDISTPQIMISSSKSANPSKQSTFYEMGVDDRILEVATYESMTCSLPIIL